jgi:hypothetical protein
MARRRSLRHNHDRGTISLNGSVVDEIGMPSASVYSAKQGSSALFCPYLDRRTCRSGAYVQALQVHRLALGASSDYSSVPRLCFRCRRA